MDEIQRLIHILEKGDQDLSSYERALRRLVRLGPAVVPACCEAIERVRFERQLPFIEVLAKCGHKDDRILWLIWQVFEEEPDLACGLFVDYADPVAIGLLAERLIQLDPDDPEDARVVLSIVDALEELGATPLPFEVVDLLAAAARTIWDGVDVKLGRRPEAELLGEVTVLQEILDTPPPADLPCWCGSKVLYGFCHQDLDKEDEQRPALH